MIFFVPKRNFHTSRLLSSAASGRNSMDYCIDLVKRRDYDHFLTNLLLPNSIRQSAFALRAFNVEVSSVREAVSDKTIGLMRMRFWRDSVQQIYEQNASKEHPVLIELQKCILKHNLTQELLQNVISSRESFLSDKPFNSLDDLDSYSHNAFSAINYLLLECLTRSDSDVGNISGGHVRHCANQLGMAEGVMTLLRGVPFNATRKRILLPRNLMAEHKVFSEKVFRGHDDDNFKLVVEAVAARGQEHLENCRFRKKFLSPQEKLLMIPAVVVDDFLSRLHKSQCNIFHPHLTNRNPLLPLSLFLKKLSRDY